MARKSSASSKIQPMIGSSAAVPANGGAGAIKGKSAGKAKRGKKTGGTLKTAAGRSGIMNPPIQGGYA